MAGARSLRMVGMASLVAAVGMFEVMSFVCSPATPTSRPCAPRSLATGSCSPAEPTTTGSSAALTVAVAACALIAAAGSGINARAKATTSCQASPAPGSGKAFNVAMQTGVCAPMGEPGLSYWDPLGFSDNIDEATFRWYRQAELKHGRVCMVAVLGLIGQHTWRFNLLSPYDNGPADLSSVPSGFAAAFTNPAAGFLGILVLVAGLHEVILSDDDRAPGDFGDPFNFADTWGLSDENVAEFKNYEINHGRLAMFGVIGTWCAEYGTGLDAYDQWGRAGSAFARTLALTSPQGSVDNLFAF